MTTIDQPETAAPAVTAANEGGPRGTAATRALFATGAVKPYSNFPKLAYQLRDDASDADLLATLHPVRAAATLVEYVAHELTDTNLTAARRSYCEALVLFGRVAPEQVAVALNQRHADYYICGVLLELTTNNESVSVIDIDQMEASDYRPWYEMSRAMRVARAGGPPANPALALAIAMKLPKDLARADYYGPGGYMSQYVDELTEWKTAQEAGIAAARLEIDARQSDVVRCFDELGPARDRCEQTDPSRVTVFKANGVRLEECAIEINAAIQKIACSTTPKKTTICAGDTCVGCARLHVEPAVETLIESTLSDIRQRLTAYSVAYAKFIVCTNRFDIAVRERDMTAETLILAAKQQIAAAAEPAVAEAALVAEPADLKAVTAQLRVLLASLNALLQ